MTGCPHPRHSSHGMAEPLSYTRESGEEGLAPLVVGVDGGGTKTVALVADLQGQVLGAARGRGCSSSVERAADVVAEVVRQALHQAGLRGEDVALGVFALSGADWPEDHPPRAAALLERGLARKVVVRNDAFAGLRAGTTRPYGVVIAAGTACNVAAIAPDGREWAFGYYADYGGGRDLAEEAIRATLRQEDGRGPVTSLAPIVLARLGYPSAEGLLKALLAREVNRAAIMSLGPLVFETALAGDAVSAAILVKQGQALAEYATALIRRFDMQALEFEVVLSGSVFKGVGPLLVDTITEDVHRVAPLARVVRARFEPAVGSVLLALDALGRATPAVYQNLTNTVPEPSFFDTSGREAGAETTLREAESADEAYHFRRRQYLHS